MQIAATPEQVWSLVTDVAQMGRWSPECTGGRWVKGATGPAPGARFVGSNRHGRIRWSTHCRVVAAERAQHFAFEVAESSMRWGYRLAAVGDGTLLTEYRHQVDHPPWYLGWFGRSGIIGRGRGAMMDDGMERTVQAMKVVAGQASPGDTKDGSPPVGALLQYRRGDATLN